MAARPARRELVFKFLAKHKDAGSRTLARLLHEQYPHEFETVENARSTIRAYRGQKGDAKRKQVANKEHFEKARPHSSLKIPEGIKQTLEPLEIVKPGKYLIVSDVHVPYHDKRAIEIAIETGLKSGCTELIIDGDFYDFMKISRFDTDPQTRDPDGELEVGQPILESLASAFKGGKYFKVGNHDARLEAYLSSHASAVVGIKHFRLDKVLELEALGYTYVANKQWMMLGQLAVLHGHELPRGLAQPVNVGRGVYNQLGDGGLVGHWHRTSRHVETSGLKRRMTVAHSIGCLCDVRPSYCPLTKWNHGMAIVEINKAGEYQLNNYIIENGKAYL